MYSPDFAPFAFYFTEDGVEVVRAAGTRWMKNGDVVNFPSRTEKGKARHTWLVVNFGQVASVNISSRDEVDIPGDPPLEVRWLDGVSVAEVM